MEVSLEYIAGFFDGEGSITLYLHRGYPTLVVTVTQSSTPVLYMIQKRFGGSVYLNKKAGASGSNFDIWAWNSTAKKAEAFLRAVVPFLIVKKAEAQVALDARDDCNSRFEFHRTRLRAVKGTRTVSGG